MPREQRLQGHAARLRRLPPGAVQRRTQNPNHSGGRLLDDVRDVSSADRPDLASGGELQPQQRLRAGRRARHAGLRDLPREQRLPGHAAHCVGCHQAQYNATRNPNHAAAGFSTTCETCHRATDPTWTSGTVQPQHRLRPGRRARHAGLRRVPREQRVQGHAAHVCRLSSGAVQRARRNPNHAAAGFPTTCETCHKATDSTWHAGHVQAHAVPAHGAPQRRVRAVPHDAEQLPDFSCTVCHARSETDGHHRGRNGYVYESNACYSCHPNGRAGDRS